MTYLHARMSTKRTAENAGAPWNAPWQVLLVGMIEGVRRLGPSQRIADALTLDVAPSPHDLAKLGIAHGD